MTSSGYTRQSSSQIVTNNTIQASDFNNEYNQLQTAFDATSGHTHSGATGQGGPVIANGLAGVTAGGTANALTATITGFTLATGAMITVTTLSTPTTAATLSVNSGAAINIQKVSPGGLINNIAGDWPPGFPLILQYNGSVWIGLNLLYFGPTTIKSADFSLALANLEQLIVASTGITITLPATTTLPSYYVVELDANGGAITLTPNGTDTIQGVNANYTIPQGATGKLYTDAAGNWYINGPAAGILATSLGGTGVANTKTITLAGNFVTSGANTLTLTTTGPTNVTLPTGGTLVNSSVATLSSLTSVGTIGTGIWQGTVIGATYGGTGINNGSNTITLGGNISTAGALTTSGAFGITLTATNTTSLTLPTSGTLATTAVATLSSLTSIGTIGTGVWQGTVVGATYGGTGVNNGSSTITIGGNVTLSGAHTFTGTLTNTTAVTFPTSGTLATLAGSETLTNKTYDAAGTGNVFKINGVTINTVSGNTSKVATTSGTLTSTHLAAFDANGNIVDGGVPTTQGVVTVKRQVFAATGTYTPSTGMLYCDIEVWGGGGAGGGATAAVGSCGGGGGSGSYSRKTASAATIGSSQTVTIGAAGTGGSGTGGNGGDTSVGAICIGKGGSGGVVGASNTKVLGGAGGVVGTGDITTVGNHGSYGEGATSGGEFGGAGGTTSLMGAGWAQYYTAEAVGVSATANSGSGGGGAASNGTAHNGGSGGSGYVVITEYCSQ